MKKMSFEGTLWLNQQDLKQKKYNGLHSVFFDPNGVFDHFQMNIKNIRYVQTFEWKESNESCDESQYLNESKFRTESSTYTYHLDNNIDYVVFQLQFYREKVENEVECSIFLKLLTLPADIESVKTEMDIICHCDDDKYRGLMRRRTLNMRGSHKGIIVFRSTTVNAKSSISWQAAIRMEPKKVDRARASTRKDIIDRPESVVSAAFSALSNNRTVANANALSQRTYQMNSDTFLLRNFSDGSAQSLEVLTGKKESETEKSISLFPPPSNVAFTSTIDRLIGLESSDVMESFNSEGKWVVTLRMPSHTESKQIRLKLYLPKNQDSDAADAQIVMFYVNRGATMSICKEFIEDKYPSGALKGKIKQLCIADDDGDIDEDFPPMDKNQDITELGILNFWIDRRFDDEDTPRKLTKIAEQETREDDDETAGIETPEHRGKYADTPRESLLLPSKSSGRRRGGQSRTGCCWCCCLNGPAGSQEYHEQVRGHSSCSIYSENDQSAGNDLSSTTFQYTPFIPGQMKKSTESDIFGDGQGSGVQYASI